MTTSGAFRDAPPDVRFLEDAPAADPQDGTSPLDAAVHGAAPAPTSALRAADAFSFAEGMGKSAELCLVEATYELHGAPDLRAGLLRVAELLRGQIAFDTLGVLLLDERGRELHFEVALGVAPQVAEHWRFGMGQGLVGTVAQTGQALRVGQVKSDPRYINAADDVRSELAVPLRTKERTIGVLDLGSHRDGFFTAEHERLLTSMAGPLAAAIDNAQLARKLREQAQTLTLLHELSREFTSILDRQQLVERLTQSLRRHLRFDHFGILLWNEESQLLEPMTLSGADAAKAAQCRSLPLGVGISGTVAALRQSIRVANVDVDPRYVPCRMGGTVRSELAAPLLFKDRLVGVLLLDSGEYDAFDERHEELLSTLASSVAIALENSRLYSLVREEERRLESDLATAHHVQMQLLPKATPWMAGVQMGVAYSPARHLGGDFYDFLPYGEGRLGLAVGDVSGKGTSAALYGALAVGILREHAAARRSEPARLLGDLNDRLSQLGVERRFLAMTFAVLDVPARSLTVAGSGLPPSFLVRGGRVEEISVPGTPLGLLPDRVYEQRTLRIEPGDMVVTCTDGLEEITGASGEEMGRAGVRSLLEGLAGSAADGVARGLLEGTDRFAAGTEPADDRTVLVLRLARA